MSLPEIPDTIADPAQSAGRTARGVFLWLLSLHEHCAAGAARTAKPARRAEHMDVRSKEKQPKESRPNGAHGDEAAGSASGPGIFGSSILLLRKRRTSLCAAPAGLYPSRLPRLTGMYG